MSMKNAFAYFIINLWYYAKKKEFSDNYLLNKVGFVRNMLAHVERSHFVLVQSDMWPSWL